MKPSKLSSSSSPIADMDVAVESTDRKRNRKGGVKNGKAIGGSCGGAAGDQFEHEMHIWTERERRKKMRNMFSSLHALLPQLPAKADKSSIVDEAVKYIKTLQHTLQTLENQKMERLSSGTIVDYEASILTTTSQPSVLAESREAFLADQVASKNYSMVDSMPRTTFPLFRSPACFQTWFSPNVVINTCGHEAQISVCSPRKRGLLTTIVYILEKHNLEVVTAHVSSDHYRSMYMIHVQAAGGSGTDQVSDTHTLSVEETFKLAAGEMNLWLLTCT
ncbi:hypothetical protein SLE2022_113070 [Rubroshorea leprosula]